MPLLANDNLCSAMAGRVIYRQRRSSFFRWLDLQATPAWPESLRQYDALQPEDYARQFELNFYAIQDFCQRFVPAMRAQNHGRILIITSEAHRLGQAYGLTHYAAAKSAALGLMRNLSREVGHDGVTINALSLGAMDNFDDFTNIAAKVTAVGRAGSAADVGAASLYLISDEASWMTGQTIALNGGSSTA